MQMLVAKEISVRQTDRWNYLMDNALKVPLYLSDDQMIITREEIAVN